LLLLLYLALFSPNFALAAELEQALPVVSDDGDILSDTAMRSLDSTYEAEFSPFDRSIIGRAPEGVTSLTNNEAMPMNVDKGTTQRFVFALPAVSGRGADEGRLELRAEQNGSQEQNAGAGADVGEHEVARETEEQNLAKRQTSRTVYISANTCEQPQPVDPSKTTQDPPQLTLYVSTSAENQAPGPLADSASQTLVQFNEGAAMFNFTTNREVYIGIHAPNVSDVFSGIYNVRVAASTDNFYYSYDEKDDADLIWLDSDSQGALLITHNLTDKADPTIEAKIMSTQPYVLFAHNKKDRGINGIKYSYCGLQSHALIAATRDGRQLSMVRTGMTKRGPGNLPKQQFFFNGLNSSSEYIGILARDGDPSGKSAAAAGAGGQVFKATSFSTKSSKEAHP
jgi:calcium channel MID1